MKSIALYVEGGGDSEAGKAALRQGFDELLSAQKNAARARRLHWKTVLCAPAPPGPCRRAVASQ